ncbi:RNA polymerase specificity factor [Starmerella bacillaris]|uniref:rRNA adenine N(6)-methyltransferase n=1 Tax=Starmerella bacillaris TaxID=1247836 RepID=A0AAV5RHJ0_STABA|nr:RNA polymerase specificity factor [Starmerella bacillaris]
MQNRTLECRKFFPRFRKTGVTLLNYDLGKKISSKLGYDKLTSFHPTVVDAYPECGVFSASLNSTLQPKKHILMEPLKMYSKGLQFLVQDNPKLMYTSNDPYDWTSFKELEEKGYLKEPVVPYSDVHPSLIYTANLVHTHGEQLVAQYLNCMLRRSWLFKYGRVRTLLWMNPKTALKILASPGYQNRARISCIREAVADYRVVIFHESPESQAKAKAKAAASRFQNEREYLTPLIPDSEIDFEKDFPYQNDFALIELIPRDNYIENLDEFEYVVTHLMMRMKVPLRVGLEYLGAGALEDLAPKLPHLINKTPFNMSHDEIMQIVEVFTLWPFKPKLLLDFYEESLLALGNN